VQPYALRALGHRCAVIDCSDGSFLCVCQKCNYMTSGGRLANLAKACKPEDVKAHDNPLTKLQRGLRPKRPGVTVDLDTVCLF
jgi:hypothetical protein